MLGFFTEPSGTVKDVTVNVDDGIIYDAAKSGQQCQKADSEMSCQVEGEKDSLRNDFGEFCMSLSPALSFKGLSAPAYVCLLTVRPSSTSAQGPLF